MPGTRTFISSLFVGAALAQTPVVPLNMGNTWVYGGKAGSFTVEVAAVKDIDGQPWSYLTGWPAGPVWLYQTPSGTLLARDTEASAPRVWVDLAAAPGEPFRASVDNCVAEGRIAKRPAAWTGAIGSFEDVLRVDYTGSRCADTGVAADVFLPWVGIVERAVQTFAGPVSSQLLYARLGETTVISANHGSFGVTVNVRPGTLLALLHLRNDTFTPLDLQFNSGQQYDLVIRDKDGKTVYVWSADKGFIAALTQVKVPRGEKTWAVIAPIATLPAGKYVAEVWIATSPVLYRASVPFEMASPLP
jgi:hypothetical protein